MRQTIDLGIDLGTTNSSIALFRDDGLVVFKDGPADVVPSVVRIDKRGNVYVGAAAYDKLHADGANTKSEFKRNMGTTHREHFVNAEQELTPEELSAHVLRRLRALAVERGETADAAVVTIPAMFELSACQATMRAAELAGLEFTTLLPEPIAAAYAYGFREDVEGLLLVYDLGGGTFDASLLRAEDGRLQVVDHAGDNHLGGKDFDWLIVDEVFVPALAAAYDLPDLSRGPRYRKLFAKLKSIAERAKIDLSRMEAVSIFEEDLGEDAQGKSIDLDVELTRADYEARIAPAIERTLEVCRALLADAGVQPADVSKMLLVGGPTRTPYVRDRLAELGVELDLRVDPMTVVARGAAIYARSQRLPQSLLRDAASGDKVFAALEYVAMSESEEPLLGGRFESKEPLPAGCTVEVTHADGHWQSGRVPLRETQTFVCTLHLNRHCANEFKIRLRGPDDAPIEIEPDSFEITHGLRTDDAPMRTSVRIGLAGGGTQVVLAKGTALPATSPEIRLRTTKPIRPGGDDHIEIPILEGEEERADRNRGGGRLVVSAGKIRRELPAGSTLEFTMSLDAAGVPERVTVYSEYLDEWFDEFERAATEYASADELSAQLEFERGRLDRLKERGDGLDPQVINAVVVLHDGPEVRQLVRHLEAVRGGDQDAAGVARNRLIELGKRIDALEAELEWPRATRDYENLRTLARRLVHEKGDRNHETRLAAVEEEAEECMRRRDAAGLGAASTRLHTICLQILHDDKDFWNARFLHLCGRKGEFVDEARADRVMQEGRQAQQRGDLYSLRSVCDDLERLLRPEAPPPGLFTSDVELM